MIQLESFIMLYSLREHQKEQEVLFVAVKVQFKMVLIV